LKVFIRTFGCQMNDRDSEALMGILLERGYSPAKDEKEADIILVNTCSVREHAEGRAISYLGTFKRRAKSEERRAKSKIVALIGCMARNRGQELFQKMKHISLICGPASLAKIPAYIEKITKENARILDLDDTFRDEELYSAAFRMEPDHAQVVISTGCSNYCSYCVVPYVRGDLRLRKPAAIIDEVKRNIDLGIKKITLLGQNVNDYVYVGNKGVVDFTKLLREVSRIEGIESLNFITSQPRNTTKELFQVMAGSKVIDKHLHMPFQSGSNRILKLMNRGYRRERFLQLVNDFRKIVKGTLSTDVIVGFPTESDNDFRQTRDIIEKVRFKYAYIFKYSPRMRARSARLDDDVDEEVKASRHQELLELQKAISSKDR